MRARAALCALAVVSLAASAHAEAPANTIMKVTPPPAQQCAVRREAEEADIGRLEEALKLTPRQKRLFDVWKTAHIELGRSWPCPPPPAPPGAPPPH
jgi:hypothetical protein